MAQAGINRKYTEATWDQVLQPELASWKVEELLRAHLRHGRGLILSGQPGTGKSSAAACIARSVLSLDNPSRSARWVYFPDMLDEMEDKRARPRIRAELKEPALLVWDDFGVDRLADWHIGFMDRVVEARYSTRRSTVITTNLQVELLQNDTRLARILSRWRELNTGLFMTGKDRRPPAAVE